MPLIKGIVCGLTVLHGLQLFSCCTIFMLCAMQGSGGTLTMPPAFSTAQLKRTTSLKLPHASILQVASKGGINMATSPLLRSILLLRHGPSFAMPAPFSSWNLQHASSCKHAACQAGTSACLANGKLVLLRMCPRATSGVSASSRQLEQCAPGKGLDSFTAV